MDQMGGLLRALPFIGGVMIMAMFAGCGLPGFANFPGEALVLFGAWESHRTVTILACWGALVIAAVYMLRAVRTIWHGPAGDRWKGLADAPNLWVKLPYALLLAALVVFGCFPRLLTDKISPVVAGLVEQAATPRAGLAAGPVGPGHGPMAGGALAPLLAPPP
jgi:NADH-quinone oxidoreductase subunit M